MADPILDGFMAMADLSEDPDLKKQLKKQVEQVISGKEKGKDSVLARLYFDLEKKLVNGSKNMNEDDVRRNMKAAFIKSEKDHPVFNLIFAPDSQQFMEISNAMISEYKKEWQTFYGKDLIEAVVGSALEDTTWKGTEVRPAKGIMYNPIRMRSVNASVQMISALFENWHERADTLAGGKVSSKMFERAYARVEEDYDLLPMFRKLLGATPLGVLMEEKSKKIHELETETTSQARTIKVTDMDLKRRSEELQRTVIELEKTKRQLEITSQARSEFIEVVSHQFRTPLSSIRWNAEIMMDAYKDGLISKEYGEAVEKIRTKSVYLIETLNRVFTALDIETGRIVLDRKPAFLWELIQDVYEKKKLDIALKDLNWKFNRSQEQVREIPIDKEKVRTVLGIIIGNSIDYNKKGGKLTVDLEPKEIDGKEYMVTAVSDEGIGLSEDERKKLFNKFFRSQPSILKVADGTGLGMYVVKNIIEAHGGKIWVESAGHEKGTTITFALPTE